MTIKKCPRCLDDKASSEFPKNRSHPDGLGIYCRQCTTAYNAKWREENRAKVRESQTKWVKNNPEKARIVQEEAHARRRALRPEKPTPKTRKERYVENREKILAQSKAWREKNKAVVSAGKADYYARNREALNRKGAEWYAANKEKAAIANKRWQRAHPDRVAEITSAWAARNPEKRSAMNAAWAASNKDRRAASAARRRAMLQSATPAWFGQEDSNVEREMYALADYLTKKTGQAWHVDHIIPLRGKSVCGLHVGSNLQVIPAKENLRKANKLVDECVALINPNRATQFINQFAARLGAKG